MKNILCLLTLLSLFVCGCSHLGSEAAYESDLTVEELEQKMNKAVDPSGLFSRSRNFALRYETKIEKGLLEPPDEKMFEVRFAQPGNLKVTNYDEGELESAYLFTPAGCYSINYEKKTAEPISPKVEEYLRMMQEISNPVMKLHNVFDDIQIKRCVLDGVSYYRLRCSRDGGSPMFMYVDANDFLLRKVSGSFRVGLATIEYQSEITSYSLFEGIRIAAETRSVTNGITSNSKLLDFKLNTNFGPDEFQVPVF